MTSSRTHRALGMLACAALLSGCYQTRGFIEPEKAAEVQARATTAKQLQEQLGTPTTTVPLGDGKTLWVYEGFYSTASPDAYIPYVGLLTGRNDQKCSKLTVVVDNETGGLGEFEYTTAKDTDHWTRADDTCRR